LVSTTLGGDLDPTLTSIDDPERSDDGLSSRLDLLVLDKRASFGLDKVDLVDFAIFAQGVGEHALRDGRGGVLLLPVVELQLRVYISTMLLHGSHCCQNSP
jgi:hypothetical protein